MFEMQAFDMGIIHKDGKTTIVTVGKGCASYLTVDYDRAIQLAEFIIESVKEVKNRQALEDSVNDEGLTRFTVHYGGRRTTNPIIDYMCKDIDECRAKIIEYMSQPHVHIYRNGKGETYNETHCAIWVYPHAKFDTRDRICIGCLNYRCNAYIFWDGQTNKHYVIGSDGKVGGKSLDY